MFFFESISRLYTDNEFDFLDVINESIHVSDLVSNWPELNSNILFGIHTGAYFCNHKNRLFEIIYDLSNNRCVFQAKRGKVKYPIGLLMKYDNIGRYYIHTNRWCQAYNSRSNQFIESKDPHPIINNNIIDKVKIQEFVVDNFCVITDTNIYRYPFYSKKIYRFFQSKLFKQYVNVEDEIIAKNIIQEWLDNFFQDRRYESDEGEIKYRNDDLLLIFRKYHDIGRRIDFYIKENEICEISFYIKVLEEYVVLLRKIGIILTSEILNKFVEECRKETLQYSNYSLLQMLYYLFYNQSGEIGESILNLFNKPQKRKGYASEYCIGVNTCYKITGRFLKLALLSWTFRTNQ